MKQRLNITLALALSFIVGTSPLLSFASSRNPARGALPPKRERLLRAPERPKPIHRRPARVSVQPDGQTTTQLSGGRLLLVGGIGPDGNVAPSTISDPRNGESTLLSGEFFSRAWHSTTMLPDGRALILGGVGEKGQVLASAGIFDPETRLFQELPRTVITPRAYHTATLLTDGSVLIAGGSSAKSPRLSKAELWSFKTKTSRTATGKPSAPRTKSRATLLPDGNVLIEGGFNESGNEVANAELYNSEAESFNFTTITSDREGPQVPFLAGSLPQDGAVDVELDSLIALRFSKPLNMDSFQGESLKLSAEGTPISARVNLAEGGRLAFLLPVEPLEKGTVYFVTCSDGNDETNRITPAVFSFTTKGDKKDEISPTQPVSDVDWAPDAENLRGNWRSKGEKSSWEDQPSLQATAGETALSGLVLTLRGKPLANVTISIDSRRTTTDHTGRFLLQDISPGHQVMVIDGRSASRPQTTYGTFRAGIEVTSKKTNILPFTIWMPKLDMAHAVDIPSPNQEEIVITNPLIPGFELHLPAGTVIRGLEGEAVTQISITPVPTDRPPFPLPPGINVPVFASIQPGGARVIPPRARLIYPNYTGERPGARINFWNYDPEGKGWYTYGQGTVTQDGRQVIPDPGVVIYEFNGIMIGAGGNPPGDGSEAGDDDEDGDPVDLSTGLFILEKTDLVLPDTIPISLTRSYRPGDAASRAFGIGSSHPYDIFLWSDNNYQEVDLILSDGGRIHYVRVSPGTGFMDAVYEHTSTPSSFYKSRISFNSILGGWDLRFKDGTVYSFPEFAPLKYIRDRYGNQLTITRALGVIGNITQITSPNGKWMQFTYDGNRISQAKDHSGRTVGYTYDASGRLWKVTDPAAGVTEYTYDTSHRLLTIKDARGIVYLTNEYNSNGRIITQTQADTSTYGFDYTLDGNGKVTQTDVTDPRGNVRRLTFNSNGYTLTDTGALGTPEEQTITYERQSGTNLVLGVTDPLNRETAYTYDSFSNITSITRLAGTQDAVTTSLTYEPTYNQVATVTDPLNHTTSFTYDSTGNLTSVTDALSHQTTFAYNIAGQLVSMTDPLSNTMEWAYQSGDLASITNPLGHTTSRYVDSLGRPVRTTDSLGRTTRYEYNALNLPTKVTDSLGGVTTFSFDPNGNLESVTDARTGVTSYTYDDMDRLETRTDPLLQEESYEYDEAGNVVKFTDRRGKLTSLVYDPLNRATFAGFGTVVNGGSTSYESTVTYSYDAVSRLEETVDSQSGTITFDYDNLDRLTSEATPQGTVSYAYDDAGRQTSMTVSGRAAVSYTYDNGDRLTGITQGTSSVSYAYDNANRRTSLTLPNGLVTEYGYDVGSNLTSITYKQGTTVLGDLIYEYDAGRNKTRMGGSYARTGLPQALSSATYDAANKMTQRASTTLSYDDNGNLTGDGVNTFSWDARNRLTAISGGTSASFQYDSFGRRTSKTVSSQTTNYLYDGANVVQELSGGTPTANMLNGAGVDERHTCDCNGAPRTLLTDALGSTLALTSSIGAAETEYTYDPFGATTTSGTASSNASQYTGRENDSTGLHFYRARYYSPTLQRFISEDPAGFGGGDVNLYAFVGNNPINLSDPGGTHPLAAAGAVCLEGALINVAIDSLLNTLSGRKVTLGGIGRSALMGCGFALAGLGLGKALSLLAGRATSASIVVGRGGPGIAPATTVRMIRRGERVEDLIHEIAKRTYASGGYEHAIVSLRGGGRAIVQGGRDGIAFGASNVRRVIIHTHPSTTGPSAIDFLMLQQTGQRSSYIYELFGGGLTRFTR